MHVLCSLIVLSQHMLYASQTSFIFQFLLIICITFWVQVSLGLLHARATHILWPPKRWQKLQPMLPPERKPLQREQEWPKHLDRRSRSEVMPAWDAVVLSSTVKALPKVLSYQCTISANKGNIFILKRHLQWTVYFFAF